MRLKRVRRQPGGKTQTTDGKCRRLWWRSERVLNMTGGTGAMGHSQLCVCVRKPYATSLVPGEPYIPPPIKGAVNRNWKLRIMGEKPKQGFKQNFDYKKMCAFVSFVITSFSSFKTFSCSLWLRWMVLTKVGAVVFQLLWELMSVGGLWWNHLPLTCFLQNCSVPVVSANSSHQNPVLRMRSKWSHLHEHRHRHDDNWTAHSKSHSLTVRLRSLWTCSLC